MTATTTRATTGGGVRRIVIEEIARLGSELAKPLAAVAAAAQAPWWR